MAHLYLICRSPNMGVRNDFCEVITNYVQLLHEAEDASGLMVEVAGPATAIAWAVAEFHYHYPEIPVLATSARGGHA